MRVPLAGGYINDVWRVGDTVRRTWPSRSTFVHSLLAFLDSVGFDGAPRYLGQDEDGYEALSYVPGVALTSGTPAAAWGSSSVGSVAAMVRRLHDVTAGSALAGRAECVCHNDLSPRNTIYAGDGASGVPVAFIDWDLAAPGRRIEDVAHVAWQWGALATSTVEAGVANVVAAADGYGLGTAERAMLVDEILAWQRRCWEGIAELVRARDPRARRLAEMDAVAHVQADEAWTSAHAAVLRAALG